MRSGRVTDLSALELEENLEENKKPQELLQLPPDLLDKMHEQWMAAPDHAVVSHRRIDPDEMVAWLETVATEAGQSVFPGIGWETPMLFTNSPRDYADCPEGKLFLGVGDVGFNEHNLPQSIREKVCCADMAAWYLDLDQNPTLMPLISEARLDDLEAKSDKDSLAQMIKRAYRLEESTDSVFSWATERYDEWRRALNSDLADPEMCIQGYQHLVEGEHFPDIINDEILGPIVKKQRKEKGHKPDSLMQVLFRSYGLGSSAENPTEKIREWGEERVRQWKEDLHNSHFETLWPELLQAGKRHSLNIAGFSQPVSLVVIKTENLINQKYAEYVAKFARWRKGWDAAVVIQVNENGNTQIFPNKKYRIELDCVAAKLISTEGDRWHFQFNTLLNGSWKHDQPPTESTPEALMEIVRKYAYIAR